MQQSDFSDVHRAIVGLASLCRSIVRRGVAAAAVVGAMVSTPGLMSPARAATSAQEDPYGDWTGQMVTDKGTCPGVDMESILQVAPKRLAFAPGTGTLVLRGRPDADHKRFHAQLVLTDASKHPLAMVFEGHPEGETIVGEFGTPSCRAHIVLTRVKTHALDNFLGR